MSQGRSGSSSSRHEVTKGQRREEKKGVGDGWWRGNKNRTEEEEEEGGEELEANGEGSAALILADRNFRWSDGEGRGGQRSQDGYKHTLSV